MTRLKAVIFVTGTARVHAAAWKQHRFPRGRSAPFGVRRAGADVVVPDLADPDVRVPVGSR